MLFHIHIQNNFCCFIVVFSLSKQTELVPYLAFNKKNVRKQLFIFYHLSREQKHWSINDQGYVSFKDISLPRNVPPENVIQVNEHK